MSGVKYVSDKRVVSDKHGGFGLHILRAIVVGLLILMFASPASAALLRFESGDYAGDGWACRFLNTNVNIPHPVPGITVQCLDENGVYRYGQFHWNGACPNGNPVIWIAPPFLFQNGQPVGPFMRIIYESGGIISVEVSDFQLDYIQPITFYFVQNVSVPGNVCNGGGVVDSWSRKP